MRILKEHTADDLVAKKEGYHPNERSSVAQKTFRNGVVSIFKIKSGAVILFWTLLFSSPGALAGTSDPISAFLNACLGRKQPAAPIYEVRPYPGEQFDKAHVAQSLGIDDAKLFLGQADKTNYFLQQYNENTARLHSATQQQYLHFLGTLLQATDSTTYHRLIDGDLNPQLRNLVAAIENQQTSERVLIDYQRKLYVRFDRNEDEYSRFPQMLVEKESGRVTPDDLSIFGGKVHFRPDKVSPEQIQKFTRLAVPESVAIDRTASGEYPRDFGKIIYDTKDVILDGPDWDRFTTTLKRLGIPYKEFSNMVWAAGNHYACELILDEVKKGGITPQTRDRIREAFAYTKVQGRTETAQLHFNHQPLVYVYRRTQFTPEQLVSLARTRPLMDPNLILSDAQHVPWVGPGVDATFTIDRHYAVARLARSGFDMPMVQRNPTVSVVVKAVVPSHRLSKKSDYARWQYTEYAYDLDYLR